MLANVNYKRYPPWTCCDFSSPKLGCNMVAEHAATIGRSADLPRGSSRIFGHIDIEGGLRTGMMSGRSKQEFAEC